MTIICVHLKYNRVSHIKKQQIDQIWVIIAGNNVHSLHILMIINTLYRDEGEFN